MSKFLADLNGEASGHIIINSDHFIWKPLTLTKLLSFGQIKEIIVPIKFIEGYKIRRTFTWKFLNIWIAGEDQTIAFTCMSPKRIVEEIKRYNPYIRMYE